VRHDADERMGDVPFAQKSVECMLEVRLLPDRECSGGRVHLMRGPRREVSNEPLKGVSVGALWRFRVGTPTATITITDNDTAQTNPPSGGGGGGGGALDKWTVAMLTTLFAWMAWGGRRRARRRTASRYRGPIH
jgi:hypothetical protein